MRENNQIMEEKKLNIQLEDNMLDFSLENNSSNTWELLSELKENSDATRREIEGLTDLITLKDNQIKDAEDKLSELEIKMNIYKERESIYMDRVKDKNDLIESLSLDSTYIKTKFDNFVELFSTMKDKITITENQPNIKEIAIMESKLKEKEDQVALMEPIIRDKDDQIASLESKVKEKEDQVALMEIKIKERDSQIKMLESRLKQRDDQVAFMEPKIKEKIYHIAKLEYKVKEKENQVALMETKNKEKDDRIKVLESNIEEDETIEPFTLYTKEMHFPGLDPFKIFIHGSDWWAIHRRFNGAVSFDRGLDEYINGFGDPNGEYWLGLERIHKITTYKRHELCIQMCDYNNKLYWAEYENFVVGSKDENYKLKTLGSHVCGSVGDMMRDYVNIPYFMYSGKGSHCPNPLRLNFNGKFAKSQIKNSDYLFWGEEPNRIYLKKVEMYVRHY